MPARIDAAAALLLQQQPFTVRHVESVRFETELEFKRCITIDCDLPEDPNLVIGAVRADSLYELPLLVMDKRPPRSNLDLEDEKGDTLSLPLRDENAALTIEALYKVAESILGPLGGPLRVFMGALVHADPPQSFYLYELVANVIRGDYPGVENDPRLAILDGLLRQQRAYFFSWIQLSGQPGQRRTVQFRQDYEATLQQLRPVRPTEHSEDWQTPWGVIAVKYTTPGDGWPFTVRQRLLRRAAVALGWQPLKLKIGTPYIHRSGAYHMQVEAPEGLAVRSIRPTGDVTIDDAKRPSRYDPPVNRTGAQLYASNLRFEETAEIKIHMQVNRRGFLTLNLLACMLTTALLWLLQWRWPHIPGDQTNRQVAAGLLLVAPALLAAFASRQSEHSFATRLLSGVRLMVLFIAAVSALATTTLATVGANTDLPRQPLWWVCCGLATAGTASVFVTWVGALDGIWDRIWWRRWTTAPRLAAAASIVAGAPALAILLLALHLEAVADIRWLVGAILLASGLALAWDLVLLRWMRRRVARWTLRGGLALSLLGCGLGIAALSGEEMFGLTQRTQWLIACGCLGFALLAELLVLLVVSLRAEDGRP